ncbi:hypothetical protein T492DRAFT_891236 [Pavlovales sp. CCMP2436]|nr:hypothetical protein T492DRAFT_891236 [Pavlovales sp. CCMP2436]
MKRADVEKLLGDARPSTHGEGHEADDVLFPPLPLPPVHARAPAAPLAKKPRFDAGLLADDEDEDEDEVRDSLRNQYEMNTPRESRLSPDGQHHRPAQQAAAPLAREPAAARPQHEPFMPPSTPSHELLAPLTAREVAARLANRGIAVDSEPDDDAAAPPSLHRAQLGSPTDAHDKHNEPRNAPTAPTKSREPSAAVARGVDDSVFISPAPVLPRQQPFLTPIRSSFPSLPPASLDAAPAPLPTLAKYAPPQLPAVHAGRLHATMSNLPSHPHIPSLLSPPPQHHHHSSSKETVTALSDGMASPPALPTASPSIRPSEGSAAAPLTSQRGQAPGEAVASSAPDEMHASLPLHSMKLSPHRVDGGHGAYGFGATRGALAPQAPLAPPRHTPIRPEPLEPHAKQRLAMPRVGAVAVDAPPPLHNSHHGGGLGELQFLSAPQMMQPRPVHKHALEPAGAARGTQDAGDLPAPPSCAHPAGACRGGDEVEHAAASAPPTRQLQPLEPPMPLGLAVSLRPPRQMPSDPAKTARHNQASVAPVPTVVKKARTSAPHRTLSLDERLDATEVEVRQLADALAEFVLAFPLSELTELVEVEMAVPCIERLCRLSEICGVPMHLAVFTAAEDACQFPDVGVD